MTRIRTSTSHRTSPSYERQILNPRLESYPSSKNLAEPLYLLISSRSYFTPCVGDYDVEAIRYGYEDVSLTELDQIARNAVAQGLHFSTDEDAPNPSGYVARTIGGERLRRTQRFAFGPQCLATCVLIVFGHVSFGIAFSELWTVRIRTHPHTTRVQTQWIIMKIWLRLRCPV